jgi:hypothetical protein
MLDTGIDVKSALNSPCITPYFASRLNGLFMGLWYQEGKIKQYFEGV